MKNNKNTGNLGETIALDYLRSQGYIVIEKNYYCPFGEIDLIALDSDCLVFVEVKTRNNKKYGVPAEAVTIEKRRRLIRIASFYMSKRRTENQIRIDIIEIRINKSGNTIHCIKNAVNIED